MASAVVWKYFTVENADKTKVKCNLCQLVLSRGKNKNDCGASSMRKHLSVKHYETFQSLCAQESEDKAGLKTCQPAITDVFAATCPWPQDHPQAKAVTRQIMEMIAIDMQPFSIVEDEGFRRFCALAAPQYNLPSQCRMPEKVLEDLHEKIRLHVYKEVEKTDQFVTSLDIWTSKAIDSYLGVIAHWVTEDYVHQQFVLAVASLTSNHTAANIQCLLLGVLEKWNITCDKIQLLLRNGGSNMVKVATDTKLPDATCFLHSLHLVVKEGLLSQRAVSDIVSTSKRIVSHFQHSPTAKNWFKDIQAEIGLVQHEEPTRWNTCLYMLEHLGEHEHDFGHNLTAHQWQLLEKIIRILQPFEEATRLCNADSVSISFVIPTIKMLTMSLNSIENDSGVETMKETLLHEMDQRFSYYAKNPIYSMATLLDPRFKNKFFPSDALAKKAISDLAELKDATAQNNTLSTEGESPKRKRIRKDTDTNSFWDAYDVCTSTPSETRLEVAEEIIQRYFVEPLMKRDECPLSFWKTNNTCCPELAKLAQKYLTLPPGTVATKRIFKVSSRLTENRYHLFPEKVDKLTFIRVK
uniref:BED-type domain-containing protein n=1 Tax=Latimeria chalumnae TaxID=7897 RepID=H3AUI6_LATCH